VEFLGVNPSTSLFSSVHAASVRNNTTARYLGQSNFLLLEQKIPFNGGYARLLAKNPNWMGPGSGKSTAES